VTDSWSHPRALRDDQYATDANLAARQSIYAYQRPRGDLPALVLDRAALRGDETVADVGCGNGRYLAALAARGHQGPVLGVDLSVGMLRTAGGGALVAGDAAALPLRTDSVDVALAMHMLYHVPDPATAVRELRRVTRPGGRVLVVLNGAGHLHELHALLHRPDPRHLDLDAGESLLAAEFASVTREDLRGELDVPDATAIEAYARSLPTAAAPPPLPPGPYHIRTHMGVLLAVG
jgi:SAM-dependent methyltransferase